MTVTAALMPPAWTEHAVCARVDPDLFFPEKGHEHQSEAAQRICRSCPVKTECLEYALSNREKHGVWGGLPYGQRKKLSSSRTCAVCGNQFPYKYRGSLLYCSRVCARRAHQEQRNASERRQRARARELSEAADRTAA